MITLSNIQLLCCLKTGVTFATNPSHYFTHQKYFRYVSFVFNEFINETNAKILFPLIGHFQKFIQPKKILMKS